MPQSAASFRDSHLPRGNKNLPSNSSFGLTALMLIAGLLCCSSSTRAELPGGIRVTAQVEPARLTPGMKAELRVTVHLPSGWIVYDLEQVPNSVLPTSIEVDPTEDIAVTETFRSEGAKEDVEPKFGSRIARFFDRTPTFRRPIITAEGARPGEHTVTGHIGFLVQQRATKRFYVITKARFSTNLVIEIPKPSATTDTLPSGTAAELPFSAASATTFLTGDVRPPRPKGPAPQFAIQVDVPKPAPRRSSDADTGLIAWIIGIALVGAGFAWGWITPPYIAPVKEADSFSFAESTLPDRSLTPTMTGRLV